ncbi:ParB/RepB/Spo0J family partition protein ParB [soil metagenome]
MSAKRSSLGRGLDALLPKADMGIRQISLEALHVSPFQPRKYIDDETIAELSASIAEKGVIQPLLVRPVASGFEIVAGERRFRAARQAGLSSVPAVVKTLSDQETLELAIIENLQREDLNAVEEAHAFQQLIGFGLNQEAVAKAVGKSRSAVANTLRLLNLPEKALDALAKNDISAGHARAILALPEARQQWALEQIISKQLSVRQAEALQNEQGGVPKVQEATPSIYKVLEEGLARHVGATVKITGKQKGRLELFFHSEDELTRLLALLGYEN